MLMMCCGPVMMLNGRPCVLMCCWPVVMMLNGRPVVMCCGMPVVCCGLAAAKIVTGAAPLLPAAVCVIKPGLLIKPSVK